jgi:transcriptional regulator with XRE-family HTH domain
MRAVDLRAILRGELDRRRGLNRRYSLRAFARQLRIDHAALSQFLRGRRRFSARRLRALGCRLGLPAATIDACCAAEAEAAVVALVRGPSFRPDSRWIAQRTNLGADAVNVTLQGLLARGALRMVGPKQWTVEP